MFSPGFASVLFGAMAIFKRRFSGLIGNDA